MKTQNDLFCPPFWSRTDCYVTPERDREKEIQVRERERERARGGSVKERETCIAAALSMIMHLPLNYTCAVLNVVPAHSVHSVNDSSLLYSSLWMQKLQRCLLHQTLLFTLTCCLQTLHISFYSPLSRAERFGKII